jgi:hypothetical protein
MNTAIVSSKRKMKLVLVEWFDSHAGNGWSDKDQLASAAQPMRCKSVGWLFSKDSVSTVIVPHCASVEKYQDLQFGRGDISIPNGSILRITVLRKS